MTGQRETRLVAITRIVAGDNDEGTHYYQYLFNGLEGMDAGFNNAPADPRVVIAKAMYVHNKRLSLTPDAEWKEIAGSFREGWLEEADAILRALGWPEEETT